MIDGSLGVSVEYASGGDYCGTARSIIAHTFHARSMSLDFFPRTGQEMFFSRFAIRFLITIRNYGCGRSRQRRWQRFDPGHVESEGLKYSERVHDGRKL